MQELPAVTRGSIKSHKPMNNDVFHRRTTSTQDQLELLLKNSPSRPSSPHDAPAAATTTTVGPPMLGSGVKTFLGTSSVLRRSDNVPLVAVAAAAASTSTAESDNDDPDATTQPPSPQPAEVAPVVESTAAVESDVNNVSLQTSSSSVPLLLKEVEVLRMNVKRLQAEKQTQLDQAVAERERLHERILSLEYDVNQYRSTLTTISKGGDLHSAASATTTTTTTTSSSSSSSSTPTSCSGCIQMNRKLTVYQRKLEDWDRWKSRAEAVAQDLAKRLREEQRIRKMLDALLATENPPAHQQFVRTMEEGAAHARRGHGPPSGASAAAAASASMSVTNEEKQPSSSSFSILVHK